VRAGEELKAAAVREVASSSGLDIEVTGLVSIEHMPRLPGWEFARFRFVVEARVLPTSGPPRSVPNEDSLKAEFFMPSEIESLPLRGKDAIRLISKHASGQPVASIDDIYHVGLS
jgi:ADP-ribose pyrophosphatase YjhB (NUDIX family)